MDKKIFEVYLAKEGIPNNEAYAKLDLPASLWELWDALDKVRLQTDDILYMEIEGYDAFEYLSPHLDGLDISINELNDLASLLSALDEVQEAAFEGLFSMEVQRKVNANGGVITLQDLRDLAVSAKTDCYHVVEAADDAQLGRFYAENDFVPELDGVSNEVFEMLDFAGIGRMMRCSENGVFVDSLYVLRDGELTTAPPVQKALPGKPGYLFRLTLGLHPDIGDARTVTLDLPAAEAELLDAQEQLGVEGWEGVTVIDYDGIIPYAADFTDLPMELGEFNAFTKAARDIPRSEVPKLKALLEQFEVRDIETALFLTEHLADYVLTPDLSSPQETAIDHLRFMTDDHSAELLLSHVNLYAYGCDLIREDNAVLSPYGLLHRADYAAQTAYFAKLINSDPNWTFVDVYADKGITGTSTEKREDFQRMMEDCRSGKIDRILVKSISRFARNTKESLAAVRELKSLDISVYFEEQNIDTAQATGETLTAVFSALAQKESEAISERMRHSYQMRMQRGAFSTHCAPYGYRLVENRLEVIEEEAVIIRQIFDRYLSGISMEDIAKEITALGIPTKQNTPFWQVRSIQYILRNEKYVGDSLLGKTYTTLTLPHRKIENKGEGVQYFIEGSHPPIVSRTVFDKAQQLLSRKSAVIPPRAAAPHPLSRKIVCGHCGAFCKRKKTRGTAYWICQTHNKNAGSCPIMQIPETEITEAFLRIYFTLKHHGDQVLPQLIQDLQTAKNGKLLWSEDIVELNKQIADIACQERLLAQLKQQAVVDPDIFIFQSNQLAEQRREAKLKKSRILRSEDDQTVQRTQELLDILEDGPDLLMTFNEALFSELVETITIQDNSTIRFRLINGLELPEHIERKK